MKATFGPISGGGSCKAQNGTSIDCGHPSCFPRPIFCIVLHDAQGVNRDVLEPTLQAARTACSKVFDRFLIVEIDDFNVIS